VAIALALVLYQIKLFHMPQGGSVTAGSMVPILILSLRRGYRLGIITGILYGVLRILIGGEIYYPVQVLLDYPVAFGLLGFAGFFITKPIYGVVAGIGGRFIAHLLSGAIFFGEYAPPGQSPWVYSAIYNGSYLIPELVVSAILTYLLVKKGILEIYK
jgi:thiamine transporter